MYNHGGKNLQTNKKKMKTIISLPAIMVNIFGSFSLNSAKESLRISTLRWLWRAKEMLHVVTACVVSGCLVKHLGVCAYDRCIF